MSDWSKFKISAEDKMYVSEKLEIFVRKGENAGPRNFPAFSIMFSKGSSLGVIRSTDCVGKYV